MLTEDQQWHCAVKFYILSFKVTDLPTYVPDPQTEVADPKTEVFYLGFGGIRLNLTRGIEKL